jgi:hypothetical protein
MTASITALWVVALTALLPLALPTSLLVRELVTETARDPGHLMLLLVYVVLTLSIASLLYVSR